MLGEVSKRICIRNYHETDFLGIQRLYQVEGWLTFINREEDAVKAWNNAAIALVAVDEDQIIGFVRGLSDGHITTYVAELVVDVKYRKQGVAKQLLQACQDIYPSTRLDLLSSEEADDFYKRNGFRFVSGFRKS